jgi:GTPase SAR1 family protein
MQYLSNIIKNFIYKNPTVETASWKEEDIKPDTTNPTVETNCNNIGVQTAGWKEEDIKLDTTNPTFCIVGSANSGKSTFVNNFCNQTFNQDYIQSTKVEHTEININSSIGDINTHLYVIPSSLEYLDLIDHGIHLNGCIIMFDLTSDESLNEVELHLKKLKDSPYITICGNKLDLVFNERMNEIYPKINLLALEYNANYYTISTKTNYNDTQPIYDLLRQVRKNPSINF